jgi:gem associated protein 7
MTEITEQEYRAFLRERYLKALEYMANKHIDIVTYQGANVNGLLRSIDYETTNLHVQNLNTPIGCVPEALVRTSDILYIKFEI